MAISITEDDLVLPNQLRYTIDFDGTPFTTTVTSTAKVVRKWLGTTLYRNAHLRHRLVVGLGVQWRPPAFSGEHTPVATLQLCVGRRCLIIQLLHSPRVPNLLRRFLQNPCHTFVGMGNSSDKRRLLLNSKHRLEMGRDPVDVKHHAVSRHDGWLIGARESRETIIRECLGLDVEFEVRIGRSNWERHRLDEEQVMYAALDAHCSFLVGMDVRAWEL